MSKIICDICGTSYADTAEQCPICGCVRPAQSSAVPDEGVQGGYTHVKGGRFSKSNVKKRNASPRNPEKKEKKNGKKGAVIILLVLFVGIIAAGVILWMTGVLAPLFEGEPSETPVTTPTPTQTTEPQEIPCEGLIIQDEKFILANVGDTLIIDCDADPVNTTDEIRYTSENENIATVDNTTGTITAVHNGITNIIITCGNVSASREVIVGDGVFSVDLVLSESSILLTTVGETKSIYDGAIPASEIQWVSRNEFVATVKDGVVTAQASGNAVIDATYMGQTVSCDVECNIDYSGSSGGITEDGGSSGSGGGITEDGGDSTTTSELVTWNQLGPLYYKNDTTLEVGDSTPLYLGNSDGSGERLTLEWTCKENDYISVSGNTVKALKSTNMNPIVVSTEYLGITYSCLIRVKG